MLAVSLLAGCEQKQRGSMRAAPPEQLPTLSPATDASATKVPQEPPNLTVLTVTNGRLALNGGPVLDLPHGQTALAADDESFIAQIASALGALDDHDTKVFFRSRGGGSFPVTLMDEPAFRAWLDNGEPGKLRVILRSDGLELSTNMGKLRGPDPNGPSVPTREGRLDIPTMRHGLQLLKGRFTNAKDAALVPSHGTELAKVADALAGFWDEDGAMFETVYLVYPRPGVRGAAPDGGAHR